MKPPKLAAMILAKGKPSEKAMSPEAPAEDSSMPSELEMAAGDAIDAIKSGDAAAFTEALKNFLTINSSEPSESSEPDLGGEIDY